jgi:hypothetical protein
LSIMYGLVAVAEDMESRTARRRCPILAAAAVKVAKLAPGKRARKDRPVGGRRGKLEASALPVAPVHCGK